MNLHVAPSLSDVLSGQHRIAVLAPHPDDESLGCGALLARAFAGAGGHVICVTDGSASHPGSRQWPAARLARLRRAELEQAVTHLGGSARDVTWMGLADSALYRADAEATVALLEDAVTRSNARHIFVPAAEDHHEDHQATARFAALLRRNRPDWSFYSYPVWSRWDDPDFARTVRPHAPVSVPSGPQHKAKAAAIRAHRSQLGAVVMDDPSGFVLPDAFVEKFVAEDELFWVMP